MYKTMENGSLGDLFTPQQAGCVKTCEIIKLRYIRQDNMVHMSIRHQQKVPLQLDHVYMVDAYFQKPEVRGQDIHIIVKDVCLTPDHPGTNGRIINIAEARLVFQGVSSSYRQVREYLNDPRTAAPDSAGNLPRTEFGPPTVETDLITAREGVPPNTKVFEWQGGVLCRENRKFGVEEWKIIAERAFIQIIKLKP